MAFCNISVNKETYSYNRQGDFSLSTVETCNDFNKLGLEPAETNEYLDLAIDSDQATLSLTERKKEKPLQECQTVYPI